jgi:hypothetical protein
VHACVPAVRLPVLRLRLPPFTTPRTFSHTHTPATPHVRIPPLQVDDELGELFLAEQTPTEAQIHAAIRRSVIGLKFVPVFLGSAYKNKGVQLLLNGVVNYLPNPSEKPNTAFEYGGDAAAAEDAAAADAADAAPSVAAAPAALTAKPGERLITLSPDPAAPLVALAFKLQPSRFGQLTYMRLYRGTLRRGDFFYNTRTRERVKVRSRVPVSLRACLRVCICVCVSACVRVPAWGPDCVIIRDSLSPSVSPSLPPSICPPLRAGASPRAHALQRAGGHRGGGRCVRTHTQRGRDGGAALNWGAVHRMCRAWDGGGGGSRSTRTEATAAVHWGHCTRVPLSDLSATLSVFPALSFVRPAHQSHCHPITPCSPPLCQQTPCVASPVFLPPAPVAGEIVATFGVDCATGDTFTADSSCSLGMSSMFIPDPVIRCVDGSPMEAVAGPQWRQRQDHNGGSGWATMEAEPGLVWSEAVPM